MISFLRPLVPRALAVRAALPALTTTTASSSTRLFSSERSAAEQAAIDLAREARKAEKEAHKLAKAAKKAAQTVTSPLVPFVRMGDPANPPAGDYELITSVPGVDAPSYTKISDVSVGQRVWVRGRVGGSRVKGGSSFVVLRNGLDTLQAVHFKKADPTNGELVSTYIKGITSESIVDICGTVVAADVKSCSVDDRELNIEKIHVVSRAAAILPYSIEDASRSDAEVEASQSTSRPFPRLGQELLLDNRWLDLRVPATSSIMKIRSGTTQLFREYLYSQGFTEIQTPKLIAGESESGAGVFKTDYFGTVACLAQSPQLYKQMAISGDMGRVFEVGPVFRAENSNTRRHLCEFTGLDIEMAIDGHYNETLQVVHDMFKYIFTGLETRWAKELAVIRTQYPCEPAVFTEKPCIIHWNDGVGMLRERGFDMGDGMQDLTGAQELALGEIIKEKYNTDFFMLDRYPSSIRPFYTMPCADDKRFSNSYDMFIRGQEICSGAQRCHDVDMLIQNIEGKGIADWESSLGSYVDSFRHGISPHAGAGIGLERVVFLFLGLDNVRKGTMFPRDPSRITP
jgi:aspartyl-tRNA synthetase